MSILKINTILKRSHDSFIELLKQNNIEYYAKQPKPNQIMACGFAIEIQTTPDVIKSIADILIAWLEYKTYELENRNNDSTKKIRKMQFQIEKNGVFLNTEEYSIEENKVLVEAAVKAAQEIRLIDIGKNI